jgi:hypothetical protein
LISFEYPELFQIVAGYFSEDYQHEGVDHHVADYVIGQQDRVFRLRDELDRVLALGLTEGELHELLRQHGCAIYPPPEDGTYTEFVRHIRRAVDAHLSSG